MSRLLSVALAMVVVLVVGDLALADGYVKIYNPYDPYDSSKNFREQNGWNGGEFTAVQQSGWVGLYDSGKVDNTTYSNSFETFCLETTEYFNWNTQYYGVITDNAVQGGSGSTKLQNANGIPFLTYNSTTKTWNLLQADDLSDKTKALYYLFRTGQLSGFEYTGGSSRQTDSKELQKAIWAQEGESAWKDYTNEWTKYFLTGTGNGNHTLPTASQLAQVKVLTLWSGGTPEYETGNVTVYDGAGNKIELTKWYDVTGLTFVQDQLTLVPLPMAVLAGIGLLGGVGIARQIRRRRNQLL